jgi:cytochrome b subunit of formate dehydrogenase
MIAIPAGRKGRTSPANKNKYWIALRQSICLSVLTALGLGSGANLLTCRAAEPAATNAAPERLVNSDCLDCHSDPKLTRKIDGKEVLLGAFPTNLFQRSIHAKLDCVDCHTAVKELVHDSNLPPAQCAGCHDGKPSHEQAAKQYATSIHGVSRAMGASGAATCASCHGSHGIVSVKQADSPVFKLNLPQTCAACHSNPGLTKEYQMKYPQVASQYQDSIHGRALLKMGLIVAPSCNDCHGVHDIKRQVDRSSPINKAAVAKTCGKCHLKVEETYRQSVHGQLLAKGDPRGPVCTDCHTAHQIESPAGNHFKAAGDRRCGQCHQDRLAHYRDTYHGKAMALGKPNVAPDVAACYDCHGHHDVLPASNPYSHLSQANIVGTCQQCHAGATASFAKFKPHANPLDGKNYPLLHTVFIFMTALLIGVFTFFGGHTALWLFRSLYLYAHDSKKFREAKVHAQVDDEWFTRFVPFERFLHFLVVTSFLLLVITGMPLKFYYTNWARALFALLGGADVARSLHHFGALITFLYFGLHIGSLLAKTIRNPAALRDPKTGQIQIARIWPALFGPDSMVPTLQDGRDFVAHQKWFFGKGAKPQFDRWTYWEKFDYFAVFWGVFAIGLSGLIMWFPQFFSRFMPGWIINIALIVHSDEALLAAGFIFTIHFFNTHFRLEKFPMDTVIFSGRISKTELLHERKRWYDRLVANGRLDQHRVKDEWERWKSIARSFGYIFFGVGIILLFLIVYAMASRLTH